MKFFSFAALASLAAAAPSVVPSSPLDVKLEMQDNSIVKAVVTNAGSESVQVVKTGSIFDNRRVQKADVSNASMLPLILVFFSLLFFPFSPFFFYFLSACCSCKLTI